MINFLRDAVVNWLNHRRPLPDTPLCDFQTLAREIQPGDVILVEGRSRASEVIKVITQSAWSHAALYLGRLHDIEDPTLRGQVHSACPGSADQQLIIESELGMGTVVRPLAVHRLEHLRICRPRALQDVGRDRVIHYAISKIGTPYDVRQVFDLARFLFPWLLLPRRWRSSLFSRRPGDSTHTVCSTMVAEAFGSVGFPILPLVKLGEGDSVRLFLRNPRLCTPRDFDYSPYFDIVKYPYLDLVGEDGDRLRPWQKGDALSEEEQALYHAHTPHIPHSTR